MTTVEGSKASIAFSQLLRLAQLRFAKPSPRTPALGPDLPGLDASAELRAMSQLTAKQNPMNDPVVKANVKGPVRKALSKPKPLSESDGEDDAEADGRRPSFFGKGGSSDGGSAAEAYQGQAQARFGLTAQAAAHGGVWTADSSAALGAVQALAPLAKAVEPSRINFTRKPTFDPRPFPSAVNLLRLSLLGCQRQAQTSSERAGTRA